MPVCLASGLIFTDFRTRPLLAASDLAEREGCRCDALSGVKAVSSKAFDLCLVSEGLASEGLMAKLFAVLSMEGRAVKANMSPFDVYKPLYRGTATLCAKMQTMTVQRDFFPSVQVSLTY